MSTTTFEGVDHAVLRVAGGSIQSTGTDAATGDLVITLNPAKPVPAAPTLGAGMVVGATVKEADFAQLAAGGPLAGARVCRTFSAPGRGILPWTATNRKVPAGVCEHLSFKDWMDDRTVVASINVLLDKMPAALLDAPALLPELHPYVAPWEWSDPSHDGFSFLLTYLHEGENNGLAPAEWRRRHRLAYDTVRAHRNGHRVGYMAIQTDTWTKLTSTASTPKGDGDVLQFWAGVGDFAAIDSYVFSEDNRPAAAGLYPSPAKFFELAVRLSYASGRRLWLPELGVILQGKPADQGGLRAAWITAVFEYLRTVDCAGASWWNAVGTPSSTGIARDFRLDPLSLQAYKKEIARRN